LDAIQDGWCYISHLKWLLPNLVLHSTTCCALRSMVAGKMSIVGVLDTPPAVVEAQGDRLHPPVRPTELALLDQHKHSRMMVSCTVSRISSPRVGFSTQRGLSYVETLVARVPPERP